MQSQTTKVVCSEYGILDEKIFIVLNITYPNLHRLTLFKQRLGLSWFILLKLFIYLILCPPKSIIEQATPSNSLLVKGEDKKNPPLTPPLVKGGEQEKKPSKPLL